LVEAPYYIQNPRKNPYEHDSKVSVEYIQPYRKGRWSGYSIRKLAQDAWVTIHATYILLYIVELWVVYSHFRVHWLVSWLQGHTHYREAEPSRDYGHGKFISSLLLSIGPSLPFFCFSFSHLFELSLTEVSSPLILYLSLPPLSLSLSFFHVPLEKGRHKTNRLTALFYFSCSFYHLRK
jgi:hypothetical protein